jgi:hypothetical protein
MAPKTTNGLPDWRADPALAEAGKQQLAFDQEVSKVSEELSRAETALVAAREKIKDALLFARMNKITPKELEAAKTAFTKAQETSDSAKLALAAVEEARDRAQQALAPLEEAAKRRCLARLRELYNGELRTLADIFTTAEPVNSRVLDLYRAMQACAPEREPWAVPEDALVWPEFLPNERHDHGGRFRYWQKKVAQFLETGSTVVSPPPAEGHVAGETEPERTARRQRAAEPSKGRR